MPESGSGVVMVMGAAGVIGREISRELVELGWSVAAFDRLPSETGDDLGVRRCEGTDIDAVRQAADVVADEFGPITALVNVSGRFEIAPFVETEPKQWAEMLDANLLTAMTSCRVVAERMAAHGSGSIVNIASTAGEYGSIRPSAAYAAAKGGVIAFSKSLARELADSKVRVNVVSPGPVDTEMLQATSPAAHLEAVNRTLLGRLGSPADIAAAVAFLLSDRAGWITGEVLRVNGGSLI
jgi:NAD(P)-dependent dehydrogenase (short-subunit alcohol dehydrogenase family)